MQEHCYQWSLQIQSTIDRLVWKGGGFDGAVTIIWDRTCRAASSPTLAKSTKIIDKLRGKRKRPRSGRCVCGYPKCDSLQEQIEKVLCKTQRYMSPIARPPNAVAVGKMTAPEKTTRNRCWCTNRLRSGAAYRNQRPERSRQKVGHSTSCILNLPY